MNSTPQKQKVGEFLSQGELAENYWRKWERMDYEMRPFVF